MDNSNATWGGCAGALAGTIGGWGDVLRQDAVAGLQASQDKHNAEKLARLLEIGEERKRGSRLFKNKKLLLL
jgi:hypothetical protein